MKMVNFETTDTGKKYFMGISPKEAVEISKEMEEHNALEKAILEEARREKTEKVLQMNKGPLADEDVELQATGYTIIYIPYGNNPFRSVKTSASGLIVGGLDVGSSYKSNETGEMENATLGIKWGKAISVGPECKYVKVGDDFCYRASVEVPVPFKGDGYMAISEQNTICVTKSK